MNKVKVIAIYLLVVLALGLVACGESDKTTAPTLVEEETVTDQVMTIIAVDENGKFEVRGIYTGEVSNGKPNGQGKWLFGDNDEEYYWEYEGEFVDGIFNGKGRQIIKEVDKGYVWEYEGDFIEGQYNGQGKRTMSSLDDDFVLHIDGTYTNGEFTPTPSEAFNYIGQLDFFGTFKLSNEQFEFIDDQKQLFPTCDKSVVEDTALVDFTYKQFTKTRKQEELGLIKLTLIAQQVFEDDVLDGKLTSLLARDDEYNYYAVYYRDSVEVYDGDAFTVYAIPCSTSSFDNVGGGTTTVIVLLACYMQ